MAGISTLKMLGRRGDTQIGHLTQGEMVVPPSAQTPAVRAAVASALRRKGVNPLQYTVGSAYNSKNPLTGALEFADPVNTGIRTLTPYAGNPALYGFGPQHVYFSNPAYGAYPTGPAPAASGGTGTTGGTGSGVANGIGAALSTAALVDSLTGNKISDALTDKLGNLVPTPIKEAYNTITGGIDNLFAPGGEAVLNAAGGQGGSLGYTIGTPDPGFLGNAANIVGTNTTVPVDFTGGTGDFSFGSNLIGGTEAPSEIIGAVGSDNLAGGGAADLLTSGISSIPSLFGSSALMGLTSAPALAGAFGTSATVPLAFMAPEFGAAALGGLGLGAEGLTLGGSAAAAGASGASAGLGALGAIAPFAIPAGIIGAILLAKTLRDKPSVGPVGHTNLDLDPSSGKLIESGTGADNSADPGKITSYAGATTNILNNLVDSGAVKFDAWNGNVGFHKGNYGYIQKGTDAGKGVPKENDPNVTALQALYDHLQTGYASVQNPDLLKNYVRSLGQVSSIDVDEELARLDRVLERGATAKAERAATSTKFLQDYSNDPALQANLNNYFSTYWPERGTLVNQQIASGNLAPNIIDFLSQIRGTDWTPQTYVPDTTYTGGGA